jgi:catechol 2,3-dioxygenase-like lactoylglutathione lyase family enzyme
VSPPFAHLGVLVNNLEEAIARYTRLGLTFMEPRTVLVERLVENGTETSLDLRITFSHQGPPRWELLEATGDGVYGPQHAEALHHVAEVVDDPIPRMQELERAGFPLVAAQYRPDGSMIVGYLEPSDLNGVRLEVIGKQVDEAIEAWVRGEEAAP